MSFAYLPIRSFGDFIITASVVKDNFKDKVPIILPSYLSELFQAINGEQYFEVIRTFDQAGQPAFFEFYKVKDIKNVKRLASDISSIFSVINADRSTRYFLDFRSKRLFFTAGKLLWPDPDQNIYSGKNEVLKNADLVSVNSKEIIATNPKDIRKILIFPDSRIRSKAINSKVVDGLLNNFPDHDIKVATFGKEYSNFEELISLIAMSDLVISAESLPYHFAYFLGKPHFVIYNLSRHFKSTFITPFMNKHKFYGTFNGENMEEIINDVKNAVIRSI